MRFLEWINYIWAADTWQEREDRRAEMNEAIENGDMPEAR